jgi:hypothetical protein
MANITNIVDSVIAKVNTHTTDITDIQESSLSKVASNVLLSGNLALASSAVTKSNANITYTGNGSTQSITTGIASVDFTVASNGSGYYHDRAAGDCIVKNDAGTIIESGSCVVNTSKVHIKCRAGYTHSHLVVDGLRGRGNSISTNLTNAEGDISAVFTSFNSDGFTISGNTNGNENTFTFIAYQTLYTHIKWGLTSQGKRYLTAYNPVTREVMTMYQGSGVAGHQIPNALGIKLDYVDIKGLDVSTHWYSAYNNTDALALNRTEGIGTWNNETNFYDDYTELLSTSGESHSSNNTFISYGFANSETKIITQYQGTGASGNFVETKDVNGVAKKPRRIIAKRTDAVSDWRAIDSERGGNSGILLNESLAEVQGWNLDFNTNGFTDNYVNSDWNASGGQYIAIVEFDTTNSNDDTYFDLPTDDTNLNVTAGKLPYTDGRDTTNGAYNVFTQSYTGSVDFSTCPDGIHYVALDSNNAPKFYDELPIFNSETGIMYDTNGTTPLTTPISFIDDKPYQVVSGTPMDRLVDYSSIPKNVMESSYVDGDLEVNGNIKSNNMFGYGQTIQDVTSSRSSGVTYTNTTSKPITVNVVGLLSSENATQILSLYVDGHITQRMMMGYATMNKGLCVNAVVPVGSTYQVVTSVVSIEKWTELR